MKYIFLLTLCLYTGLSAGGLNFNTSYSPILSSSHTSALAISPLPVCAIGSGSESDIAALRYRVNLLETALIMVSMTVLICLYLLKQLIRRF
jgi:hypothetical protein